MFKKLTTLQDTMKKEFVIGFQYACHLWRRADLESRPHNIVRVAQILEEAGIEVFEINLESGFLTCAPRPLAVREALTGEYTADYISPSEYPPETPGEVLKLLVQKGILLKSNK
jgi:hypothetical protein